jgi:hypothetical protein
VRILVDEGGPAEPRPCPLRERTLHFFPAKSAEEEENVVENASANLGGDRRVFDNPGWLVAAWEGDEEALIGYADDDLV